MHKQLMCKVLCAGKVYRDHISKYYYVILDSQSF